MIRINQRSAVAAADLLCLSLEDLTPEEVVVAYRTAALTAHPDKGGSVEDFNRIKQARDLLTAFLKQPKPEPTPPDCVSCLGKGFIMQQRGWRTTRQVCPMCKGRGHAKIGEHQ